MTYDPMFPDDVPDAEEAASVAGLALAPWVEAQAEPIRVARLLARMSETEPQASSKASKWRLGVCNPRGWSLRRERCDKRLPHSLEREQ